MKQWLVGLISEHQWSWVLFMKIGYWILDDEEREQFRRAMMLKYPHLYKYF